MAQWKKLEEPRQLMIILPLLIFQNYNMRIINKFGGEIMGNPQLVKLAVMHIKEQLGKNQKPLVVVLALAGITDKLINLSQTFNKEIFEKIIKEHENWIKRQNIEGEKLRQKFESLKNELKNDLKKIKRTLGLAIKF